MQGAADHGRRTPERKASGAGRLTPGTNSRSQCQFGVLAVGDSLQYVRADMVVPDGFSAGQQADGGSTLRLEGRV